jgi:hypothetical protein
VTSAGFKIETLNPSHYADLAALKINPRHPMNKSRVGLFARMRLVKPIEPPRATMDSKKRRPPARRAYELTEEGKALLAARPDMIGRVGRVGWGG